ncbi:hypothetical protein ASG78_04920 [Nostocoides sp. Soil756]|jgi:hypothetical protein|nr:hypothetical protein ASG78_04920 [Tetrasphaera sp. Soil756]
MPYLRATLENGAAYEDPSEDVLFMLLEDVAAGHSPWVIVDKPADSSQQTYAQAVRLADGLFQVERRRGDASTHEVTSALPLRDAHAKLTAWAYAL